MNGTLSSINKFTKLKNKRFRHSYLKEHIKVGISSQIRILRTNCNLSQSQLADLIKTKQSVISRLEDPDTCSVNLNTLMKIAEAFDVALLVKFVPFGKFLTETEDVSPKNLSASSFSDEYKCIEYEIPFASNDTNLDIPGIEFYQTAMIDNEVKLYA